jgi:DNA invertase Pin-like site-specific DNA recombinase
MFFTDPVKKKAVAYYRHSAEDKQENSVPIQREHAQKFADQNNIEIIHEEADEGISGLIANRPGFKRLLNDWVQNSDAPQFDYVLFYDISRWGRFQDQNEGAHYAFICKNYGKTLVNVSRGFPKEGQQMTNSLVDAIDRFMAAEYSRVLSEKVWYGCIKVSKDGYSAGGAACYGMARLLLDENKKPIRILKKGEHKMISNQRVTFTPVGDETTKAVQKMFKLLVEDWYNPREIAEWLNKENIPSASGGKWNKEKVLKILTNETYTGSRVYNKTWHRLKQKSKRNPRSEWTVCKNAFKAIVSEELFIKAQEHLYWLMPSKWKKGIYTVKTIRKLFKTEVENLLKEKGIEEDLIFDVLQKPPLSYCVKFYKDSIPHWCFVISEKTRFFEKIIGVGVSIDGADQPVDRIFTIPTDAFNEVNCLVFSEKDSCFSNYIVKQENIKNELSTVVSQV